MRIKTRVQRQGSRVLRRRIGILSAAMTPIAQQGAQTAEAHARQGLAINVYSTTPGNEYTRTGYLLSQIYSSAAATATSLGILVGDRAPYASEIEYGTGPHELTEAQLKAYLDALPRGGTLRFGRSGQAYMLPGPYLGPAMIYARTLTRERLHVLMQSAWR